MSTIYRCAMSSGPMVNVVDDPAAACAASIARRLRAALGRRGAATLALSGGSSAPPMLAALAAAELTWSRVGVWQVDERVAPDGDEDRNANQLAVLSGRHRLMPVTDADLSTACGRYARTLPERFDVVHLGMGDDGHTASWPPGDPIIDATKPVAVSAPYQGRVRMTLTPPVVNAATGRVVLLSGAGKAEQLAAWVDGTGDPPIARVRRTRTVVFCDAAAASLLAGTTS
jgi:6-phosphogluconolactonase/glucosamine-6-phosphate isomerase/deaminase